MMAERKKARQDKITVWVIVLLAIIAFVAYAVAVNHWRATGVQDAYARMSVAYHAGDHTTVLEIYNGRAEIPLRRDAEVRAAAEAGAPTPPDDLYLQVGDSYSHLGNGVEANRHYLKALGWTAFQYDAWCRLYEDCPSLGELAKETNAPSEGG